MGCKLAIMGAFLAGWAFGELVRLLWGRATVALAVAAALASSGCALLAPVEEHDSPGGGDEPAYYHREGDVYVLPGVDGGAPRIEVDAGVATREAAVDASTDAGADARKTCQRAPEDAGSGPACTTSGKTRHACNHEAQVGADCESLGESGGSWWFCC